LEKGASMTTPLLETRAAFARRLGVNKSTVTRAIQAGRLVLHGDRVDVAASLERWHATAGARPDMAEKHATRRGTGVPRYLPTDPAPKTATESRTGRLNPIPAAAEPPESTTDTIGSDKTLTRTAWKAATLRFENATIRLHMALDTGQRHRLDAVQREAFALGAAAQGAVERLIDHTAPRLAATPDRRARAALLGDECGQMVRRIKGEFVRSARRLRAQGRAG